MIYVASPYSHPSAQVREDRAYQVGTFTAIKVQQRHIVYSPIASWHHLAKEHNMPGDFGFWNWLNFEFLDRSSEMWVLCLDGWRESTGVQAEIKYMEGRGLPVRYFHGSTFEEIHGDHHTNS
jgi:hypothetical protein